MLQDTDHLSTFFYDNDEETSPDTFSLTQLTKAVGAAMCIQECNLVKLAEGGYHKVYKVSGDLRIVVRVAAPAFPKDKLESEILGVPASAVWDTLPFEKKQVVVAEVAKCILQLFHLRFDTGGSLYHEPGSSANSFIVGPVVSTPFYRALDGVVRFPNELTAPDLRRYRGPFLSPTSYVRSPLETELHILRVQNLRRHVLEHELDGDEECLEQGIRVLEKAVKLASIYPGDICISSPLTTPGNPFSLRMDDFRLSNVMIDENTGHITGLIDFEGATIAPLWECAYMPRWLQDREEWDGSFEGGSSSEKASLRKVFNDKMTEIDPTGEWKRAHDQGRPFREFTNMLNYNVGVWANDDIENTIDEWLEWAKVHPGEGLSKADPESHILL
ncbi:hypothetical protein HHX47_DHR6000057 [Lentinula edodes]|nr:hypothetical protein HHX47_DHR6000057 [Lentinula edodes]